MQTYSFGKGLGKGVLSLLAIAGSLVALAGFSDITITSLIQTYLFPVLGSLTVGGVITVVINWVKFRTTK